MRTWPQLPARRRRHLRHGALHGARHGALRGAPQARGRPRSRPWLPARSLPSAPAVRSRRGCLRAAIPIASTLSSPGGRFEGLGGAAGGFFSPATAFNARQSPRLRAQQQQLSMAASPLPLARQQQQQRRRQPAAGGDGGLSSPRQSPRCSPRRGKAVVGCCRPLTAGSVAGGGSFETLDAVFGVAAASGNRM